MTSQALIRDLDAVMLVKAMPGDEPLEFNVVRPLVEGDVPHLIKPSVIENLKRVTARHHQLAKWVAEEKTVAEISALGGVTTSRVYQLLDYPDFQELVAHYRKEREIQLQRVEDRLQGVGLQFLDELQARMDEAPEKFTNQQVMDGTELLLVKSRKTAEDLMRGGGGGVQVNVKFISGAKPQSESITIEGEVV